MAALVMAPKPGLKTFSETVAAAREGVRVSDPA
jgi:crotonyl-CoA carboxylase/reductase